MPFANLTSPVEDATESVSVSVRFNPEEKDIQDADVVILSKDHVQFYAHRYILLLRSSNNFGSLLSGLAKDVGIEMDVYQNMSPSDFIVLPTVIATQYSADVLNVVLHIIYSFPVESYHPSPSALRTAADVLFDLGYTLDNVFTPHSEPYMLFLKAAAAEPLAMYALAAKYSLESLAVAVSTFTLAASLSDISDVLAHQMGPVYLRRLFCRAFLLRIFYSVLT
jgi:hypothetical protein